MEKFELKILKVETKIEKDNFNHAHDVGNSGIFSTPKNFIVSYECETCGNDFNFNPKKVYFKHTFKFSELMSRVGGCYSCRKESDFVLFIKGKKENHVGGLRGDESYFTCYGEFISKFQEGEKISVLAISETKTSKVGNDYLVLKRVKIDRSLSFHSLT